MADLERQDFTSAWRVSEDRLKGPGPEGLWRVVQTHDLSMCGIAPTQALLWAAPALGIRRGRLVRYRTSSDVSGDLTRIVGDAGLVLD